MPRLPRIQFAGAIYHVVTRGDGRRKLFHDARHYERLTEGLEQEVERSGWIVLAYCWMPNHIHVLLKTPEPNLARGMQRWLSGYANWYAKRWHRTGHLYEGRYKAFLVESEGYYWNISRYIHLNPCQGSKPLATAPEGFAYSSYRGYVRNSCRESWIAYDELYRYWRGLNGGKDAAAAYRKFVKDGLLDPLDPKLDRLRGWVYGGEDFLKRMVELAGSEDELTQRRVIRRMKVIDVEAIIEATASFYKVEPTEYFGFRSGAAGREMAAYLCRRWTGVTLRTLSERLGLSHPDSAANLVRRAKIRIEQSAPYAQSATKIERKLHLKTENQA